MSTVTDPRFDPPPEYPPPEYTDAPPREKSGCSSCMTGCLIVAAVLLVLAAIAGFWLWHNWRDLFATGAETLVAQAVEATALPGEEKQEILDQVERLTDAIRDERLSAEQSALVMQRLIDSPLLLTLGVSAVEKQYIETSGLSDEEKAESRQTLNRFLRGAIDGKIPEQALNEALMYVADRQPGGEWRLRQRVADQDLRKFLATAKMAADEAEIPDQVEGVDPSEELKRLIDAALK